MTDSAGGSTPRPDPTLLTTEQLLREVGSLEKTLNLQIAGMETLFSEKFRQIQQNFEHVEARRVEQKKDTQAAVDSAFAAAKEAVREQTIASDRAITKAENSTIEQLKQLSVTFTTALAGVNGAVDTLRDRVTAIESIKLGGKESTAAYYALAGVALTIIIVVVAVMNYTTGK